METCWRNRLDPHPAILLPSPRLRPDPASGADGGGCHGPPAFDKTPGMTACHADHSTLLARSESPSPGGRRPVPPTSGIPDPDGAVRPRRLRRTGDPQPEPRGGSADRNGIRYSSCRRLCGALGHPPAAHRAGRAGHRPSGDGKRSAAGHPAGAHHGRHAGPRGRRAEQTPRLPDDLARLGPRLSSPRHPQGGPLRRHGRGSGRQRDDEPQRRLVNGDPSGGNGDPRAASP